MDYAWRGRTKKSKQYPNGLSKGLRTLELSGRRAGSVEIDAGQADGSTQLYKCLVSGCDKRFKAPHVAANHFRSKHKDLNAEKDSWRAYVGPV